MTEPLTVEQLACIRDHKGEWLELSPDRVLATIDALQSQAEALTTERDQVRQENDHLRASTANNGGPCLYCSLPKERWAECHSGFPGCDRADDAMMCPHVGASLDAEARIASLEAVVEAACHCARLWRDALNREDTDGMRFLDSPEDQRRLVALETSLSRLPTPSGRDEKE